ncbi:MAG: acyl-phosphate glycerol 3-phosphate acyltransferase [Maricaulis sp.]|jgi:glycerol-3-phosphate acyltransferase PlsY|nr:acyl-phosphate glycerol 3-phosphate acyltransferase [Maricaulis sp.]
MSIWTLAAMGLAAGGGYLLGSIPFGLVITKLAGLGDIRAIGSGNIGATNVLRTGRKDLALATLVLDAGKAGIAALIFTALIGTEAGLVAGGAAFFGHCFPVWLGFKGGKGVATFYGTILAVAWPVGVLAALTWIGMALLMRISSLSALVAAAIAPVIAYAFGRSDVALLCIFLAVIIYWRHRANIERLIAGTEPRIGGAKA